MLKLMYDMYMHYAGNEHDPNKNIYSTKYTNITQSTRKNIRHKIIKHKRYN